MRASGTAFDGAGSAISSSANGFSIRCFKNESVIADIKYGTMTAFVDTEVVVDLAGNQNVS